MSNKAKIWLYKKGNECNAITGGWTQGGHVPAYLDFCGSKEQEYLHITSIQNYRSRTAFVANNMIDMSYFNKVYINFDISTSYDLNQILIVGSNIKTSTSDNISGNISSTNPANTVYFTAENESVFASPDNTPCYVYIEGCIDHTNYFNVHDVYVESKSNVINIVNNEDDIITFNLNNINNMIEFTQVDIIVNNEIVQSYKDNINDSISYNFSNNKFFTIQATYTQGDDIVETAELEIGFKYENGIDENTVLYLRGDSYTDLSIYNNSNLINQNTSVINDGWIYLDSTYMSITYDDIISMKQVTTIEFDISFNNITDGNSCVISRGHIHNQSICDYELRVDKTAIYISIGTGTGTSDADISSFNYIFELYKKYHIALVFDGSYNIYINGSLIGTHISNYKPTSTKDLYIGDRQSLDYSAYFKFSNFRVSNIARYTENFELPTQPYTSVNITDIKFDNNNISCQIYKGSNNETISKVDVLLNGNVINSLTENYNIINQAINEEECGYGDNEIEVRAYYYDDYYVNKKYNYYKDIHLDTFEPLPNLLISSDLYTIKNRISEINAVNKIIASNLKKVLEIKGFECGETPRLSKMVEMVKHLGNNNSAEITELKEELNDNKSKIKSVLTIHEFEDIEDIDNLSDLIDMVLTLIPAPKYYIYKSGQFRHNHTYVFYDTSADRIQFNEDHIKMFYNSEHSVTRLAIKDVDVTEYSKIVIDAKATVYTSYTSANVAANVHTTAGYEGGNNVTESNFASFDRKLLTIDVSNLTGLYYLNLTLYYSDYYIYNIYMEKKALAPILYLYDGGDKVDITGGWNLSYSTGVVPTFSQTANGITFSAQGSSINGSNGFYATINAIDLTGYSYLKAIVTSSSTTGDNMAINVSDTREANYTTISYAQNGENIEVSLDVSSINRPMYIQLAVGGSAANNISGTVTKIWLE